MKTSLRRWRGFSFHKHGGDDKDRRDLRPLAQLDELDKASQDMQDMKDCYDSLLSAAAATANCAFEFSESLQELGACLLEKTALNDNEESGKVLLKLGKVQFELQKLVDSYRSHIFRTITIPSESLLNELQTVEEMKQQCDEKRNVYEHMVRQRQKGRSKSGKGEMFTMQQLREAHNEYDQEATLFVFRLKSLKQGQSRSLLTQAARHHAAQLCFFKKALKSLETLEPHVKNVTEQQHIDYQFSGLEDDDLDDDDDDDDNGSDSHGDWELSFDYGQNDQEQDFVSSSRKSMELDQADITFPQVPTVETAKENPGQSYRKSLPFNREIRISSQSAPLFIENKSDADDKRKQMRPSSSRKFNTYVLPTPVDTKSSQSTGPAGPVPGTLNSSLSGRHNLWHSSPLDPTKFDKSLGNEKISRATAQSVLRESTNNTASTRLPPPSDGSLFSQFNPRGASDSKRVKRQAFSGPLTGKPWTTKSVSKEHPLLFSVPVLRNPVLQPPGSSPKVSPSASPTFTSLPKISELHELPRPPTSLSSSSRPKGLVGHSAPLLPNGQVLSAPSKSVISNTASPLPKPPQAITRSFSIPSSSHKMEAAHNLEIASPPLTPISLINKKPSPAGSNTVGQTVEIRGNSESSALVSLVSLTFSPKPNMAQVDIQVASGSFASSQFRSHIDNIMTF